MAFAALLMAFFALTNIALAQETDPNSRPDMMDRGSASLLVEGLVEAGQSVDLAIRFLPNEGWHGYWSNPGDAGQGMSLEWDLPEGWDVGEPLYPVPQTYVVQGLMNHIYEGPHAIIIPLFVPDTEIQGQAFRVSLFARWLTCSDRLCVPQQANLQGMLMVGEAGQLAQQLGPVDERFDGWRAAMPPLLDQSGSHGFTDEALRIAIPIPAAMDMVSPHIFLGQDQHIDYAAPQVFWRTGDMLIAEIPRGGLRHEDGEISGILKLNSQDDGAGHDTGRGVRFTSILGDVPSGGERVGNSAPLVGAAPLWLLLGGALLGGLLLNLMPCVFPILSLKAMTLVKAGGSEAEAKRDGLAYTAGVVLACLALGGLLLALRAAGHEIGWAFQLQSPVVVVVLLVLAMLITANFAGLFDLPSLSFTGSGGRASSFSTGLLAAFVATPCTGPFMAAALGAALVLPWWQALMLFAALGLGLALPFLLLGWVPALRGLLPKPGAWMETFRKIMAIPMGLTALALLWLCWQMGGFMFAAMAYLVGLVASLVIGVMFKPEWKGPPSRRVSIGLLLVMLFCFSLNSWMSYDPETTSSQSLLEPQEYSEQALTKARASGQPVFLWFTADWCLTCKVNEKIAIEREATREAFEAAGVIAMRGDWTSPDPEITRFLTEHGVAGVPLYLYYSADGEGAQLGQILTPDTLIDLAQN